MANITRSRGGKLQQKDKFDDYELQQIETYEPAEHPLLRMAQSWVVVSLGFILAFILLLILIANYAPAIREGLQIVQWLLCIVAVIIVLVKIPSAARFGKEVYRDYINIEDPSRIDRFFMRFSYGFMIFSLIFTIVSVINFSLANGAYNSYQKGENPAIQGASVVHKWLSKVDTAKVHEIKTIK